MHRIRRLCPSPATAIALLALFIALGGSAYAVTQIDGALIKKRSIANTKLKKDTLTGAEIKESKLGKVPKAKNAGTAGNALALGGKPPGAYFPANRIVAFRLVKLSDGQNRDIPMGPVFTVRLACGHVGVNVNDVQYTVLIKSTQAGSVASDAGGAPVSFGTSFVATRQGDSTADDTLYETISIAAIAPDGTGITGRLSAGVRNTTLGAACIFSGFAIF